MLGQTDSLTISLSQQLFNDFSIVNHFIQNKETEASKKQKHQS